MVETDVCAVEVDEEVALISIVPWLSRSSWWRCLLDAVVAKVAIVQRLQSLIRARGGASARHSELRGFLPVHGGDCLPELPLSLLPLQDVDVVVDTASLLECGNSPAQP